MSLFGNRYIGIVNITYPFHLVLWPMPQKHKVSVYDQVYHNHTLQTSPQHREEEQKNIYNNKVRKGAKIRNRYHQVPHLTQYTNGKVTNSQLDTTNESQEVSPFPAGDHIAHINRRSQRHSKHKTDKT